MENRTEKRIPSRKAEKSGSKKPKKNRFWTVFGAYLAVMVVACAIGLKFFYDFTAEYEATRPESAIDGICEDFRKNALATLVAEHFTEGISEYESVQRAVENVIIPALGENYSYRKLAAEYTKERPVYALTADGRDIAKLYLTEADEALRFGMKPWTLGESKLTLDLSSVKTFTFTLSVPDGVSVKLNGKELNASLASERGKAPSAKYESDQSLAPEVSVYRLDGFLALPEVEAKDSAGTEYPCTFLSDSCSVDLPESVSHTLRITAPSDAVVTVGSAVLGKDEMTSSDIPYDNAGKFNASYRMAEYTVRGLVGEPSFTVKNTKGDQLSLTTTAKDTYKAFLPTDKLHTATIMLPEGTEATVLLNGVELTENELAKDRRVYPELEEIASYVSVTPTVYEVTGLYEAPSVEIKSKNGEKLEFDKSDDPDVFVCTPKYDDSLKAQYESVVNQFVSAYIYYTANGGTNTAANFAKVEQCLLPGSQAHTEMRNTLFSFQQNFQFHISRQEISSKDYRSWGEDCFSCTAEYDVTLSRWKYVDDSGTMKLIFVRKGGTWLLAKVNI